MAQFRYKAQGTSGIMEGVINEVDKEAVIRHLMNKGLRPLSVEAGGRQRQGISISWPRIGPKASERISSKDVEFFTKQLALLVKGGLSLDKALRLIGRQTEKVAIRVFAARLERKLKEGLTLSAALGEEPAFSTMYANIVRAGEEGGVLPEMLMNISDYQSQSRELKQFIVSSSVYPLFLLSMGIAILIILVAVILPRFQLLFEGMNQELPMNVTMLMAVADFCSNHFLLAMGFILGPPVALISYIRSADGRVWLDKMVLRVPVIRNFVRDLETTRIFRTMEVLVSNGVHFITALRISSGVVGNQQYQQLLANATTALKEGQRVAPKLRGGLIPALAVDLLAIGEESGRIGDICGQIARHFEQELRERLKRFVALLEPAFILVMAVGAGYIVLSMLTVILSMNDIAG